MRTESREAGEGKREEGKGEGQEGALYSKVSPTCAPTQIEFPI